MSEAFCTECKQHWQASTMRDRAIRERDEAEDRIRSWVSVVEKRSSERDEARAAAKALLRMFHLDNCVGLDELLEANPWLREGG